MKWEKESIISKGVSLIVRMVSGEWGEAIASQGIGELFEMLMPFGYDIDHSEYCIVMKC